MNAQCKRQWQGSASHAQGKRFEVMIEEGCRYYARQGIAQIEKTPEPMRVIRSLGEGRFVACFEKAAQPDYKGVLASGKAVIFEAKSTHTGKFAQDRVTLEQAERLDAYQRMGAVCFVLLLFDGTGIYRVPWAVWKEMKGHFGRKYVSPEHLKEYVIGLSPRGTIDFLSGLHSREEKHEL